MKAEPNKQRKHTMQAFFLRGLIALLPIVFTLTILVWLYAFVTQYVTGPVNNVIYWSLEHNGLGWRALDAMGVDPLDPAYLSSDLPRGLEQRMGETGVTRLDPEFPALLREYRDDEMRFLRNHKLLAIDGDELHASVVKRVPPVVGLVVSLMLVLSLGSLAGGFVGRSVLRRTDRTMHLIPVVRSIYPYTKQLVDFFLSDQHVEFDTVVAAPYPNPELLSLGFVTSAGLKTLREKTGENLVSVFIPSSPMPMTGYTIFIPAEKLTPLPFTVDEALRTLVSGGVLIPPHELADLTSSEAMTQAFGEALPARRPTPKAEEEEAAS